MTITALFAIASASASLDSLLRLSITRLFLQTPSQKESWLCNAIIYTDWAFCKEKRSHNRGKACKSSQCFANKYLRDRYILLSKAMSCLSLIPLKAINGALWGKNHKRVEHACDFHQCLGLKVTHDYYQGVDPNAIDMDLSALTITLLM